MPMRITGLNRVRSKGRIYLYDRKTGSRLLSDPADAVAVAAELQKIRQPSKRMAVRDGTLGALILAYRESPEFLEQISKRTRADYEKIFDYLRPRYRGPIEKFNQPDLLLSLRDRAFRKHKRRFANYVLQVVRLLLNWGKARRWNTHNAAVEIELIRRPRKLPRANRPWTPTECQVVLDRAPIQILIPIGLGMFAGAREADALTFHKTGFTGTHVRWTAGKNGREIWLPAHPKLIEILGKAPKNATIFCLNSRGKPWTQSGFRASFFQLLRRLREEGLIEAGLTFHGLRHSLGDALGDAGADTRDIAAVLGISEAQAEYYSRGSDGRRRAARAMGKLLRWEQRGKKSAKKVRIDLQN
jgi:hypothetical protein